MSPGTHVLAGDGVSRQFRALGVGFQRLYMGGGMEPCGRVFFQKPVATYATERFHCSVLEWEVRHDGDPLLARHVGNARRRPDKWGIGIGKGARRSARKIDAAVTAVLVWQALLDAAAVVSARRALTEKVQSFG